MKLRQALVAATLLAAPVAAANAQPLDGLYVTVGGGMDSHGDQRSLNGSTPSLHIALPGSPPRNIMGTGEIGLAAVGWGFGNGIRSELEFSYRENPVLRNVTGPTYDGNERQYSFMLNAFYDFDVGLPVKPFIGAGAGLSVITWNPVNRIFNGIQCCLYFGSPQNYAPNPVDVTNLTKDADVTYGVQVMAGFNFPVESVPGLSVNAQYRYFAAPHNIKYDNFLTIKPETGGGPTLTGWGKTTYSGHIDQSLIIGVTYAFNAPVKAAPAAAPVASAIAPAPVSRSYIVFFDWDKADLTDRARQIVGEAAAASKKVQVTKIEVNGYTDTSGTAGYNKGLSIARAKAVMAELVKDGVPANSIAIMGYGDSHLLVPTAAGVREPQNRRVEIILK